MEIDVESDDGLTVECPTCRHPGWFHPVMVAPEGASIFCEECGQDFGTWPELHARLFTAGAMLAETLAKKA